MIVAAVVLVIAMASIYLLGFFPGTASDAQMAQSQTYWVAARPTGVYDARAIEAACNGSNRGYTMVLENHESTPIRLTGITVAGQLSEFCRRGQTQSGEIMLEPGEKTAIEVPASISASTGQSISMNVSISYTSTYGLSSTQHGSTPLIITNTLPAPTCSYETDSCASMACCSGLMCNGCAGQETCETGTCGSCGSQELDPCNVTPCCDGMTCLGGMFCISSCFLPGTMVQAPDGGKPIEQIKEGDIVYSFSENGAVSASRVSAIYVSQRDSYYRILAGGAEVNATAEHPFLTPGGYMAVSQLAAGDILLVYKDGSLSEEQITSISQVFAPATVYNLQVDGDHTFFANGFAVHNKH
jgi:hypothetical protein